MSYKQEKKSTEKGYKINPMSILSISRGIKSYYNTYRSIRHIGAGICEDKDPCSIFYIENYMDCIILLHHFFELTFKDLLSQGNDYLILNYNNIKDKHMFSLYNKATFDTNGINSVEFSSIFSRLTKFINKIYWDLDKEKIK